MFKQSMSRNQRSRGVRMKHVLQIIVLLGICFWLIYQVKHSHDRRRELSGKDTELSNREQVSDAVKSGRKDLNPRLEETVRKNEKHDREEEEDEDKHEEGEEKQEEELSKPEGDQSEEITKHEEVEGQEGEANDREVEEEEEAKGDELKDQDNPRDDVDREEDFIDEEKEREEESSEGKEMAEDHEEEEEERQDLLEDENQNLAEDEAHDEVDRITHEAREEHYKGDDASSAVTHDNNQLIGLELEKFNLDFANESKITTNTSNQVSDEEKNGSVSDGKEIEMSEKGMNLKEIRPEEKDNENENGTDAAKVVEDSPSQNYSVSTENNGTKLIPSEMNTEDVSTSPLNGTETALNLTQVQNSTVDDGGVNTAGVSHGKGADLAIVSPSAGKRESSNSTSFGLGLAASDQKLRSDEKNDGGGNVRLPSTMKENNENDTRKQELEERQSESGEVKTG